MRVGIIGLGNMGYAIAKGLVESINSENFLYYEINSDNIARAEESFGKPPVDSLESLCKNSDYIIMAVKPNVYENILKSISEHLNKEKTVISIAPGLSLSYLSTLAKAARIVRVMPNTPARVLEGMSGICFDNTLFDKDEIQEIKSIFSSFGKFVIVDEKYMDAVVAISGCSPAYFYLMIEAMADAGVGFGLPRAQAYKMAAQSMLGSAKMVLETGEHPAKLKDDVCSPGGATIEAVNALNSMDFRGAIIEAMNAAYQKSKDMGQD